MKKIQLTNAHKEKIISNPFISGFTSEHQGISVGQTGFRYLCSG